MNPLNSSLDILYPHVVKNGVIILDDYGAFPGANKAIDEFLVINQTLLKLFLFQAISVMSLNRYLNILENLIIRTIPLPTQKNFNPSYK